MSNLHNEIGSLRDDAAATQGVVTCPSCRTRWRVERGVTATLRCRCSRCDEVFSAGDAKTPYRVRVARDDVDDGARDGMVATAPLESHAAATANRDLRVGMDDPSLAQRLGRTVLHGGADRKAWTWTVVADPESTAGRSGAVPDRDSSGTSDAVAIAGEATVIDSGGLSVDEPEVPEIAAAVDLPAGPETDDRRGSETLDLAVDGHGRSEEWTPLEHAGVTVAEDHIEGTPMDVRSGPASLRESPLEPLVVALDQARAAAPAAPGAVSIPGVDEFDAVVHDDMPDAEPNVEPDRRRRAGVGTLAVVVVMAAAGAMAAWTWAPWLTAAANTVLALWPVTAGADIPADPRFWAGPGAAFGLLLGWGWLRWALRRR